MKNKVPDDYVTEHVRDVLEDALSEAAESTAAQLEPSADQLLRYGKRRHFALGLILVAFFPLLLAFVVPKEDVFVWVGYSVLLMLVGAWHWDKAKNELVVLKDPHQSPVEDSPKLTLHSFDGDAP